jgi:hypothetical protein
MGASAQLVWSPPPSFLSARVRGLQRLVTSRLEARAKAFGVDAEARMKVNAPWTNRTGAARAGLSVSVVVGGTAIVLTYAHGVFYGIFLELKNQGRYAIVIPSISADGPALMASLGPIL